MDIMLIIGLVLGSSAYSNKCRVSENYYEEKYVIQNNCNCSACSPHNGQRLCFDQIV